jgi:hypothetical protein
MGGGGATWLLHMGRNVWVAVVIEHQDVHWVQQSLCNSLLRAGHLTPAVLRQQRPLSIERAASSHHTPLP